MNDLLELMKERRSIRKYQEKQIPREALERIVEAGLYAPNAGGGQRRRIVAVRNPVLSEKLGRLNLAHFNRATIDNEEAVLSMLEQQENMRIPTELIPHCPHCGKPLTMNLRSDNKFVQDEGWNKAAKRYEDFLGSHQTGRVLYLELGVGYNTPGIIKIPFWKMSAENPDARFISINAQNIAVPEVIKERAFLINSDIGKVLSF